MRLGSVNVRVDGEVRKNKGRVRVLEEKKVGVGCLKEMVTGEGVLLKEGDGAACLGKPVVVQPILDVVQPPTICVSECSRMQMYRSLHEDKSWASKGVVATIVTGDSMLSVQQQVEDADFHNISLIPMGGDRVFLYFPGQENIIQVINDAIDFFSMIFGNFYKWTTRDVLFGRGAWVRVYGTPIHA